MNTVLVIFWAVLIFASIFWYGFLVFHIGIKAGREIRQLIQALSRKE
jgi:hypothetical protein